MASRFSALALRGEAFLLETEHAGRQWSVLVDGGQDGATKTRPHPLVQAIKRASPGLDQIDIAICTHNDADHAGGFPTFLEEWLKAGKTISEVWLPWRWSAALPLVLTDPDAFIQLLADGASQAADQIEEAMSAQEDEDLTVALSERRPNDPESLVRKLGRQALRDERSGPVASPTHWIASEEGIATEFDDRQSRIDRALGLSGDQGEIVRSLSEETEQNSIPLSERAFANLGYSFAPLAFLSVRGRSLFNSTLETAERIRTIADTALQKQILVRWFDFDEFEQSGQTSGGIADFLEPVNTVEMKEPRRELTSLQLLFSLKLTEQNVESLVFQRIESDSEPGVFFLGDSRLAFGVAKPERNFPRPRFVPKRKSIITAAHHGSRVNDRAYEVLDDWLGASLSAQSFYVRNGGMWKQTLETYLTKSERRCAQCQQCFQNDRRQEVVVGVKAADWQWPPAAKSCGTPNKNAISIRI